MVDRQKPTIRQQSMAGRPLNQPFKGESIIPTNDAERGCGAQEITERAGVEPGKAAPMK